MSQTQIKAAIAQQEEHIRRQRSCAGKPDGEPVLGLSHSFYTFSPRPGVHVRQCWRCKVTGTNEDWELLIDLGPGALWTEDHQSTDQERSR